MSEFIDDAQFMSLFEEFEHTAWRWETRQGYDSDRQTEAYQRFLQGEDPDASAYRPWCMDVRRQTAQGKRIGRVRLVDAPPTPEQGYLLVTGWTNIEAGEDIRSLLRSDAAKLDLPMADFWLFDARTVLQLHFDDQDRYLGSEVVRTPGEVLRACQVRDTAWHHAVRCLEFGLRAPTIDRVPTGR
ncbi:hypothetical protein AQ490_05085 [Wenjunlia vitaminophila]|uniref:DUF6879 domain-containing protein n=1 Tax=Wenjunlia vitaminophila TaxID=76728 RepID=A0A0T6LP96_WENVI|nr:DUF6879 family protein [Wenjunlia vitaminophila]KRV47753.1 hypothetical protein AQ490_05085 [Wenjunlia vitaminophila]